MTTINLQEHVPLRRLPSMTLVKWVVEREFGVTREEIESHDMRRRPTIARQVAQALAYTPGRRSFHEIGKAFSGRDHTTVMNAVDRIRERMEKDPTLAKKIERCKESCLRIHSVRSHYDDLLAHHREGTGEMRTDADDAIIAP